MSDQWEEGDESETNPFGLAAGGFDLGGLLAGAQQMMAAQQEAASQEVTGSAGGGAVTIVATGGGEFRSVSIRPEAVDPDDVAMLEDLVLAALNDTTQKIAALQSSSMGGLDMGALGGLLGGS